MLQGTHALGSSAWASSGGEFHFRLPLGSGGAAHGVEPCCPVGLSDAGTVSFLHCLTVAPCDYCTRRTEFLTLFHLMNLKAHVNRQNGQRRPCWTAQVSAPQWLSLVLTGSALCPDATCRIWGAMGRNWPDPLSLGP